LGQTIELMVGSEQYEELQHLTRLSISGIAAGMRTSG
jgi:hypothetical protein